jgi:nicotinate-nucleotide--dimethylbenzimidazole phosphoribosyltransferase
MGGGDALTQTAASCLAAEVEPMSRPVAVSCRDISRGPAMSIAAARQAVETGIDLAEECRQHDLLAVACQSRGVRCAASAIAIRCLGEYKESDLPESIEAALMTEILSAACDGRNGLELLAALGGFDLGGATGLILASAAVHRPIILSDFAATAAALVAARLEPFIRDYLFTAAVECPLHRAALSLLGAPLLTPEQGLDQSLETLIAASSLFIEAGCA